MKTPLKSLEIIKEMYEHFVKTSRELEPKLMICEIEDFENVENALKEYEFQKRIIKDLEQSKEKLINERTERIIEHRVVYDDYNFQNIKKFVACKDCQYYENEKCINKDDCFWLDLERKLKALEIIKKEISGCLEFYYDDEHDYGEVWCVQNEEENRVVIASADSKEEFNLLKEELL